MEKREWRGCVLERQTGLVSRQRKRGGSSGVKQVFRVLSSREREMEKREWSVLERQTGPARRGGVASNPARLAISRLEGE